MLPLKEGEIVVIDPNFKGKLHFGPIPSTVWLRENHQNQTAQSEIGIIKELKYMHPLRSNVYAIQFPSTKKKLFWFKECEIC